MLTSSISMKPPWQLCIPPEARWLNNCFHSMHSSSNLKNHKGGTVIYPINVIPPPSDTGGTMIGANLSLPTLIKHCDVN